MSLNEKISYIKGLVAGLKLNEEKSDTIKVLNSIIDFLDDVALSVTTMEELYDQLSEQVDAIDEDLSYIEEEYYEDHCLCGSCEEPEYEDDVYYEVTCNSCDESITISEDELFSEEIDCPTCGNLLEFDFSSITLDTNESENSSDDENKKEDK